MISNGFTQYILSENYAIVTPFSHRQRIVGIIVLPSAQGGNVSSVFALGPLAVFWLNVR